MFAIPRVVIFMTGDHMVVYAGDVDVDMDLASQNVNDNCAPKDASPEHGRSQGKSVKYVRSEKFRGPEQPEESTGCRKCRGGKCSVM